MRLKCTNTFKRDDVEVLTDSENTENYDGSLDKLLFFSLYRFSYFVAKVKIIFTMHEFLIIKSSLKMLNLYYVNW